MGRIALLILALLTLPARADLVRVPYEGVRPTGMGNAFIAIADDSNALWYNPAGLTQINGVHANLFDFTLGADSTDSLNRLKNGLGNGNYTDLIRQGTEFLRAGLKPSFITKYFGLSLFENAQTYTNLDLSSLAGHADIYSFNDIGAIAGVGLPVSKSISVGVSMRAFERSSMDVNLNYADILAMAQTNPTNFQSAIYQHLSQMMGTGWGIGMNIGALVRVPTAKGAPRWQFAATMEDVGQTTFHQLGSLPLPAPIRPAVNFGTSLQYALRGNAKLNLDLDLRNNFQPLPFIQQVHFGAEYRHPLFALRAGLYQGYPCAGFSIETPPHTRIHFSTYEVELGNGLYQNGQRWYLLQLEIGFNPI